MATVWMTYAWGDNDQGDVDFVAQELVGAGVNVKLDRWNLGAGKRLWEQIERFIQDPRESDAWIFYATQTSLTSEPCREELAYALDRALRARGETFPVIGLVAGAVDNSLLPAAIRTRLYVSLADPNWKERIRAAAERRPPAIGAPRLEPYAMQLHGDPTTGPFVIEVRPRAGSWSPFVAAIPMSERDRVKMGTMHGPRGRPPMMGALMGVREGASDDGKWWIRESMNEATPTQSYFIRCAAVPSHLAFGEPGGSGQFVVDANAIQSAPRVS